MRRWVDFLPASAVLAVGVVLSVGIFLVVRSYYQGVEQQRFQRDATYYGATFRNDVERHVASLAAIRAFVSASRDVSRWEFSIFAHQTLPQNSGFKAVLWVPHVEKRDRKAFEAQLQRDGLYGLRIRDVTDKGQLVIAGDRPSYLPVAYVEPFDGNGSLVGLDLSRDPVYAQLFHAAQQTDKVAASAPVAHALIEGAQGPVVLVAFPLDPHAAPPRGDLPGGPQGYALGVLQLDRIIADSIGSHAAPIQAAIAYGPGAAPAVFVPGRAGRTTGLGDWFGDAAFHRTVPFDIAGQHFLLALRWAGHGDPLTHLYAPLGAALLTLALTIVLAQSMLTITLRKRTVERAVVARTAELRTLNKTLSEEVEQRRAAEAGLRSARDKAESANRAKSVFLSTMSHELRTPLNAIIGFSGILTGNAKAFDARSADYLREINDSGTRLLDLINDILDIAQMDAEGTPDGELVYLPDIVDAVIVKMHPQANKAAVSLRSSVPDPLPLLRGDGRRLQKALLNLVSNAVKFTAKGGRAHIAVRAGTDGSLTIEVSDNGVGMPPGVEARILELFSQFDTRLARSHEGAGLGLTFVRRVAELHDAALHISSKLGEGTQVSLTFPAHRVVRAAEVA